MSTVIETYGKYVTFLKAERRIKDATFRKVNLSLAYFAELYGGTDTKALNATDVQAFYHWLQTKKSRRTYNGEKKSFGSAHLKKILTHIKAYIKRLSDNAMLTRLVPGDVPTCKITEHRIAYLTKQELSLIMNQLETGIVKATKSGIKWHIYSAYLWRAVVRMLYTTGLRNAELRGLTYENLNIPELYGEIIGKGDKAGIITYSEMAAQKLIEYLELREEYFPETKFSKIFTLYGKSGAGIVTEQKLNLALKRVAFLAGVQQNIYAHLFRHTLATHLLQDGWTIVDVKQKLRHSNIVVTSIYVHSNPEVVKSKTKSLGTDLLINGKNFQNDKEMLQVMHSLLIHLLHQSEIINNG